MPKLKIAVDNQISHKTVSKLEHYFHVVTCAEDLQDEEWVGAALDAGALVIVSPDLDIPSLLSDLESDAIWLDVPQGLRGVDQFGYIKKMISKLKISKGKSL